MAFQNCNVNKLKSALNKVDNISYDKLNNLINDISFSEWTSPSERRIIEAIKEIISEYKTIQKKINNYKKASEYIEEYKDLESDYDSDRNKVDKYKSKLKNCDENDIEYYNNKIDSYNNRISNKKQKMDSLVEKAVNLAKS